VDLYKKDYLEMKVPVTICHTGECQWAISVDEDPEFWLDVFPTEAEAIEYCTVHDLPFD